MSIRKNEIVSADWVAITEAGESGTCWVQKKPLSGQVVLNHSDAGTGGIAIDESYSMTGEKRDIIVPITPDNENDIFYAICVENGAEAIIISDVV